MKKLTEEMIELAESIALYSFKIKGIDLDDVQTKIDLCDLSGNDIVHVFCIKEMNDTVLISQLVAFLDFEDQLIAIQPNYNHTTNDIVDYIEITKESNLTINNKCIEDEICSPYSLKIDMKEELTNEKIKEFKNVLD